LNLFGIWCLGFGAFFLEFSNALGAERQFFPDAADHHSGFMKIWFIDSFSPVLGMGNTISSHCSLAAILTFSHNTK